MLFMNTRTNSTETETEKKYVRCKASIAIKTTLLNCLTDAAAKYYTSTNCGKKKHYFLSQASHNTSPSHNTMIATSKPKMHTASTEGSTHCPSRRVCHLLYWFLSSDRLFVAFSTHSLCSDNISTAFFSTRLNTALFSLNASSLPFAATSLKLL